MALISMVMFWPRVLNGLGSSHSFKHHFALFLACQNNCAILKA